MIRLPDNSTDWHKACQKAVDFANDNGGDINHGFSILSENGWETFGIENVSLPEDGREIRYINTGETYTPTVCQEGDKCFVSSWGNWLEIAERKYCKENDVIRCGHCGEFTPLVDGLEWYEVLCEHCDKYVNGANQKKYRP